MFYYIPALRFWKTHTSAEKHIPALQKRNQSNHKNQWYNVLVTFIFKFNCGQYETKTWLLSNRIKLSIHYQEILKIGNRPVRGWSECNFFILGRKDHRMRKEAYPRDLSTPCRSWAPPRSSCCITLHHTATHCNTIQHTVTHYTTLQHTAAHCNTLQHTASNCNALLRTVTHIQHTTSPSRSTPYYSTHA